VWDYGRSVGQENKAYLKKEKQYASRYENPRDRIRYWLFHKGGRALSKKKCFK
jgi:hypothetical protein